MSKINEKELHTLFARWKENEKEAYTELYQKYSTLVYKIAFSILKDKENAEDIMQNVFIKLSNLAKEKLPSKYEASWLYSVTKNEAISYLRKNKENLPIEEAMNKKQKDDMEELLQRDSYEKMLDFLEKSEKQIVSLKVETGLSFKEISKLLKIPIGTVQWKYYKSLHNLKLLIGNFSLFIITATLCITKMFIKERKKESNGEEIIENNTKTEEIQKNMEAQEEKKEVLTILPNGRLEQDTIEEKQEIIQYDRINENIKMDFIQVGLFSITFIFLCFSIFFAIVCTKKKNF